MILKQALMQQKLIAEVYIYSFCFFLFKFCLSSFCLVLYAYSVDMACQDKSFSYFVCFSYSVHIALPHSLLVLSSCCLFRILNLQLIPKGRQEWVLVRLTRRKGIIHSREQVSHLMMIMHDAKTCGYMHYHFLNFYNFGWSNSSGFFWLQGLP